MEVVQDVNSPECQGGRDGEDALRRRIEELEATCEAGKRREAALADKVQSMRELLECNICFLPLCWPVSLSCGHVFCSSCISKWELSCVKSLKRMKCPSCRASGEMPVPSLLLDDICKLLGDEETAARRKEEAGAHRKYKAGKRDRSRRDTHAPQRQFLNLQAAVDRRADTVVSLAALSEPLAVTMSGNSARLAQRLEANINSRLQEQSAMLQALQELRNAWRGEDASIPLPTFHVQADENFSYRLQEHDFDFDNTFAEQVVFEDEADDAIALESNVTRLLEENGVLVYTELTGQLSLD
jgi:hypothetical protein